MAKKNDSIGCLGALAVIALGVYAIYNIDWGFSKGQITDYTLKCPQAYYVNNQCVGTYVRGPVTVYTVKEDQQIVVSQVDGEAPNKLTKCAVVDRKNWKCNGPEGNDLLSVSYADGVYQGLLMSPLYKHVSKSDWLSTDEQKP